MPMSIRLDPALEARVEAESRRRGVTKSEVVKDALEQVLGVKTPWTLYQQVYSGTPMGDPDASTDTGRKFAEKLRANSRAPLKGRELPA
ncbi:MAG TPA: CopG family transcriptional regulator [Steroidobacteraceae bacterium]|nr:CopG family transcriptional regulator [Steroidobacteraceae bacterium]